MIQSHHSHIDDTEWNSIERKRIINIYQHHFHSILCWRCISPGYNCEWWCWWGFQLILLQSCQFWSSKVELRLTGIKLVKPRTAALLKSTCWQGWTETETKQLKTGELKTCHISHAIVVVLHWSTLWLSPSLSFLWLCLVSNDKRQEIRSNSCLAKLSRLNIF